ncbi:MAG: hypothetical protein IJL99_06775 [Firmicutes bacterium]|nr:hypothetical protein [Bacillota bacterium]
MIKKVITVTLILAFALFAAGCGATEQAEGQSTEQTVSESETQGETTEMKLFIGEEKVTVDWANNDAVAALREEVKKQPLAIDMSMYDDFEQVGELGMSLPAEDEQITTKAGDIMLYSGDNIVVFYGSNTWSYTPLGKITDKSPEEMAELLGQGDVTITINQE